MSQNQLIKSFLSSLLVFQQKGFVSNSTLQQTLKIFKYVLNLQIQFPAQLASRLLTTLIIEFRKISKIPTTNQSNLLYQNSQQKPIEQYILILYLDVLELTISKFTKGNGNIMQLKELFIVLIATIIQKIKVSQSQYLLNLLKLLTYLVTNIINKNNNLIQTIFPNVASNLFNLIVQFPIKSNKISEIVFKCLGILIQNLFFKYINKKNILLQKSIQIYSVEESQKDFKSVCLKKLEEYVQIIVDNPHHFDKVNQVKTFIIRVIKCKSLENTLFHNLIYKLGYLLGYQQSLQKPKSFCLTYLRSEAQKHLKFLNKNKDHYQSKLTTMLYNYSFKIIGCIQTLTTNQIKTIYSIIKPLFKLNSNLIKSFSSHNYSLLTVHSQLILNQYIQIDLKSTIDMFNEQFLKNNIHIFQNQQFKQISFQNHIKSWNIQFCESIIQYIFQDLISNPYSTTISITSFKKYLQTIIILKQFIFKLQNQSLLQTIFQFIKKSDCLNVLEPSNQQQEFLIAYSYDILRIVYEKLVKVLTGYKKLDLNIQFIQTTISLFNIQNNTITTYCNYYLLKYSYPISIGQFLYKLLSTIVYRNKYNIIFIQKAIQLANTYVTPIYAEYIYSNYNMYSNVQKIIFNILPSLSTQTLRKAVLSITTKNKWIDALSLSIQNLNNRPLSKQQSDSFNPNDSDNAVITNCLGVVLIQIESRFKVELQNGSSKILDLLFKIFQTNSKMIFCSKLYQYFYLFLRIVDCESVNKLTFSKVSMITKVLKLLQLYLEVYGEDKIDQILKQKQNMIKVFGKLGEYLEIKIDIDETMKEITQNSLEKLKSVCTLLFNLEIKKSLFKGPKFD